MMSRWLPGIASVLVMPAAAVAQGYPSRQVTMIVPFAAGGPVDNGGRVFADAMRRQFGSAVLVDNRPGAGGIVGTKIVIAAKPDGYTLLIGSPGPLIVSASAGAGVDPDTQLAPVGLISESPQIVVASKTVKADTLAEFIAFAQASPGTLSYSSAGIGTMPHLAGEMFKSITGIDMLHVPYRGTGAALPDLISGRNHLMIGDITSMVPMLEGGRLKSYAITATKRSELVANVPTTTEAGLPRLVTRNWNALMGPVGLPQPVVTRLNEAMRAASKDADYLEAMRKQGAVPSESSPDHLSNLIVEERNRLAPIVKAIGLKLE